MYRKFSPGSAAARLLLAAITIAITRTVRGPSALPARLGFLLWLCLFASGADGAANTWTNAASLAAGRAQHTSVLMPNGRVLVMGNIFDPLNAAAEVFDPATGTWSLTSLREGRYHHTATVLLNGKVLLTGGEDGGGSSIRSVELYDPATGTSAFTGYLTVARSSHTATVLNNGKVLVAGGGAGQSVYNSAELYDPATGAWTATGSMTQQRYAHSATLLASGKVLVVGGNSGNLASAVTSAELYDPATGLWTSAGAAGVPHAWHTATLLPNGKVIVAGGASSGSFPTAAAEMYDPASNAWGGAGSLSVPRSKHTATLLPNGRVCFAGGERASHTTNASVDLYDSVSGGWSGAGSLTVARMDHSATLLPNGQLLVAGGNNGSGGSIASVELFESADGNWAATGSLVTARTYATATLLPNGKVLTAGGTNTATTELYDPAAGTWSNTGALGRVHYYHTATLLTNGKVLVAGGRDNAGVLTAAETYDPATGGWTGTGALGTARQNHAAALLANGNVLVAGGDNGNGGSLAGAEIYNSATGVWTGTGALAAARRNHTLTLLPNGKVLLAGGDNNGSNLASAQLYDPVTGVWTATGSLTTARSSHTATLLPGGRVLVAGGGNGTSSSEIYDPSTGTWTATGSLATARFSHTATLLPGGQVLVAGGYNLGSQLASAEIYNPATGRWSAAGFLAAARNYHTATLLANGKVLVAAGSAPGTSLASAQLYDAGPGFSAAWQPVINSVNLAANNKLVVSGVRLRGVSGASGGNGTTDSSTNFPLLQVRRLDNGLSVFLASDPAINVAAGSVTSDLVPLPAAGHVLVTVIANGVPSQAWPMFYPGTAGITVEPSGEAAIADGGSATIGPAAVNASALRTFTVKNPGVGPLNLGTITIDGADAGSFAVAASPAAVVAPGGSTTFTIRFTPATRETKIAALHLPNNVYGSTPFDINLSGVILESAIAVEQPAGSAVASGGVRIVGPVATNLSTNKTFTIKNTGGVNLTGFAFTIDGPNAAEFSILVNPATTVAAGGSTTFVVQFAPTSTGLKTAALHLASNAASLNPYHVKLTGISAEGKPFTGAGSLPGRDSATATALPSGKVLVAGGSGSANNPAFPAWAGADLYDPATGNWSATSPLAAGRSRHTATLLNNGKVLVVGGDPGSLTGDTLASAALYDPASGTWSATGSLAAGRFNHTATLLPNGKVLVTGGQAIEFFSVPVRTTAEIYDPATGTWTAAGTPGARHTHTATLLSNGKVLIAGGSADGFGVSAVAGAQLYDPASGNWSATGPLASARFGHSATLLPNGQVLVAGGGSGGAASLTSAELYNPDTGAWSPTGSLATAEGLTAAGYYHTATLLPNNKVLVAGGRVSTGLLAIAELYDPATGSWTPAYNLASARWLHTATLLPGGRVLFAGGMDVYPSGNKYGVETAELYDPSAPGTVSWVGSGSLATARAAHTATLLHDSTVLVAGGSGAGGGKLASAEIKARDTGLWTGTGSLGTARDHHTATLLGTENAVGKVLVAGGSGVAGPLSSAELYNPFSKTWTPTGALVNGARTQHTATLLPNGKVLVTGGSGPGGPLSSAEIYDPASGTWSPTGSLSTPRDHHTATLLPNGKVLVAGGASTVEDTSGLSSAELYDPATGFWTPTGSLGGKRHYHTATLLPNGKVLVVGGRNSATVGLLLTTTAEIYDPATGGWTLAGDSGFLVRQLHTATLMPDGKVLLAGGGIFSYSKTAMIFDPAGSEWSRISDIGTDRYSHTATLLHSGGILLTSGGFDPPAATTELYDLFLNFPAEWRPKITGFTPDADGSLIFFGTGFLGITGFSPPTVKLRRLDNDQTVVLERDPATSASATQFKTRPFYQIPFTPGYQMLTFTADGIPGMSLVFALAPPQYPADIVVEGIGGEILPDGGTQSFGTPPVNYALTTNFTIRNPGSLNLTGINITLDGANAADFSVTASPAATVAGGGSTTFTVQFKPTTAGAKAAALHIANNVPGKSPYDINLTGTAQASQTARELWRQQYFGTTSNTGAAADTADPDGDGQNNNFEFTAGLVPTDRNSRFNLRVELVPGLPGPKRIFFSPLLPGRTYVVKSTTSLTTGPWTVLNGINTDTGTERRVTDIDALMGLKFYRVEITLSP